MLSTMPNPTGLPAAQIADPQKELRPNRQSDLRQSTQQSNGSIITSCRGAFPPLVPPPAVHVPTAQEIAEAIESELARSAYPLHEICCRCDGTVLILGGQARCYHHVQVALTMAMTLAGRRRVVSEVSVQSRDSTVVACDFA